MKTLRYLLIVIGILSVTSVAAVTYGPMYQPKRQVNHTRTDYAALPSLTMSSTAAMMTSGSALPMAAVSGTTTTDDYAANSIGRRPRRIVGDEDDGDGGTGYEEGDKTQEIKEPDVPLGDAVLPLMLMAIGYLVWKRRRREENAG